ncbi:hypothetical protein BGLA2_1730011 [Burkholderia gladioli]|nr:hypothetical protein BGLA2_1730011 [Burkholderia gladioli]
MFVICLLLQCAANREILPALWDYPQRPLSWFANHLPLSGPKASGTVSPVPLVRPARAVTRSAVLPAPGPKPACGGDAGIARRVMQEPGLLLPPSSGHVL